MRRQLHKTAIAVGLTTMFASWSSATLAAIPIDSGFIDTVNKQLLIDGGEFTKNFCPKTKVFVSLKPRTCLSTVLPTTIRRWI